MDKELKQTLEDLNRAFEAFKQANDERLKQIEAKGSADPLLVEKVEKANSEISQLTAQLREQQQQIRDLETAAARVTMAPSEQIQAERQHASEFFALVRGTQAAVSDGDVEAYRKYRSAFIEYCRRGNSVSSDINAALSVGANPDGGYLVPPDLSGRIVERIYETSPMRQIAFVGRTSRDTVEGPLDLDEVDTGWVGETDDRDVDTGTPEVGKYSISIHEQFAQPRTTQKILDDPDTDVEAWLIRKLSDKFSRTENASFINGDGVNKPRGILTYPTVLQNAAAWGKVVYVKSGASGAFASSNPGDPLIDLVYGLKKAYRRNARWIMNSNTLAAVRKLKDGEGNYLWVPNFQDERGSLLLGYPVTEFEDMPDLNSSSLSVAFGNFAETYSIYDRKGIRILRDPYTKKGWIKFYTTKRLGGDVVNFEAFRVMKFTA